MPDARTNMKRGDGKRLRRGGCNCGAVRYTVCGPARQVIACHCEECRRASGHFVAATQARAADVAVEGEGNLAWYASSERAERGFCRTCGSNLFFRAKDSDKLSIMAGTLDRPTGLRLVEQIWTDEAGDYYALPAMVPKRPRDGISECWQLKPWEDEAV